jgi:predicted MPP superfamily phosphohydrolase
MAGRSGRLSRPLIILHFSDAHLRAAPGPDQRIVVKALLDDVRSGLDVRPEQTPDIIAFTGDLVQAGDDVGSFETAVDVLLRPLSETASIPSDRFVMCPGNHDVQLGKRDKYYEKGLTDELVDKDSVNAFFDQNDLSLVGRRFEAFREVRDANAAPATRATELWSTHRIVLADDVTVGVAALNSAWRSTGATRDGDKGRLIVGERQVDLALADLEGCDFVAVLLHHPLEYLHTFDEREVRRRLFGKVDAILTGHTHDPDPQAHCTVHGECFLSRAGCVYQSRSYFNGYSILAFNPEGYVKVTAREYLDDRRAFKACERVGDSGSRRFQFSRDGAVVVRSPEEFGVIAEHARAVEDLANGSLLSSIAGSSAPRDIRRLFVEPPLSDVPESEFHAKASRPVAGPTYLSLTDLLEGSEHLIFLGRQESGKSTLCHRILMHFADSAELTDDGRVPLYVGLKSVKRPNMLRDLREFGGGRWTTAGIKSLLSQGRAVAVVDDVPLGDDSVMGDLRAFAAEYPRCRLILTADEEMLVALGVEKVSLGVDHKQVYMHAFNRARARALARTWFGAAIGPVEATVEELFRQMRRLALPKTPFLLSLVFWILENQRTLQLINHAALVERFLNALLEKLHASEGLRDAIDYRIKEHFLAHLSGVMVSRGTYALDRGVIEQIAADYFKAKGFPVRVGEFIQYFIDRGVLVDTHLGITFRYRCFAEYFIARQMIEDPSFRETLISEERYLSFINEIDYFTGIQRNNRDLIEEFESRVEKALEDHGFDVDLTLFEGIAVGESPLTEEKRKKLLARVKEEPKREESDSVLDRLDGGPPRQDVTKTETRDPVDAFFESLRLWSCVLRNGELVDDVELKGRAVRKAIRYWAKLATTFILLTEEFVEDERLEAKGADKEEQERRRRVLAYFMKVVMPLATTDMMVDSLSSTKLVEVIGDLADDEGQDLATRLLATLLLSELPDRRYTKAMRRLTSRKPKHRFTLEVVFHKLYMLFLFKPVSDPERAEIKKLIGDIFLSLESSGQRRQDRAKRDQFLQQLQRKWLLYGGRGQKAE